MAQEVPAPVPPSTPDLRIVQANERTFLAWIRSGLGLVLLGFGLTRLNAWLEPGSPARIGWAFPVGAAFALLGLLVIPIATFRHHRIHRDLCLNRPVLPSPWVAVAFAGAVLVVAGALVILTVFEGP